MGPAPRPRGMSMLPRTMTPADHGALWDRWESMAARDALAAFASALEADGLIVPADRPTPGDYACTWEDRAAVAERARSSGLLLDADRRTRVMAHASPTSRLEVMAVEVPSAQVASALASALVDVALGAVDAAPRSAGAAFARRAGLRSDDQPTGPGVEGPMRLSETVASAARALVTVGPFGSDVAPTSQAAEILARLLLDAGSWGLRVHRDGAPDLTPVVRAAMLRADLVGSAIRLADSPGRVQVPARPLPRETDPARQR